MIRHCAMFRVQSDTSTEVIEQLLQGFVALKGEIDGMVDVVVGPNLSAEGLSQGFDHGIVMDFTDSAAVQAYLVHPAHLALAEKVVPRLENGLDGALPFDFEL